MNTMTKRFFMFSIPAIFAALSTFSAQAQSTLEKINASKNVKIGILTDFPPFGLVGSDMKPQGLDIDLANIIAQKLGAKPEFVILQAATRIPSLQTNKVDILVASMAKNPEREQVVDFTLPYAPYYQAVYGRKNIQIKNFSDLAGKTVAVARGSTQDENLQKAAPPTVKIMRFEASSDAIQAAISGQTQFIAIGSSVISSVTKKNKDADLDFKLLLMNSPNYLAVRKGDTALRDKLDQILKEAKADGTLEKLSQKWLNESIGDKLGY